MWFPTVRSDLRYTDISPYRIANVVEINASPRRVFDLFATGEGQTEWFADFVACRWTSKPPFGFESTREIELKLLTVMERFLVWEPGKRMTFSIDGITLPIVDQMLEDLQFEPGPSGHGTRLTWHVHYTPATLMVPFHPIARAVFSRMFRKSAEGLKRFAEANP